MNYINSGINIDTFDYCGRNAIFYCNQVDAVKAMIAAGIELNSIDNNGKSVLDLSATNGVRPYDVIANALMRYVDKIDGNTVLIIHVSYHF
ncbi:hypothetical protein FHD02_18525 [Citrobacter sp. EC_71]|uniref:hypothetical protein n=1 Tax=Citrobacter sp. EC_71 TaxID=2584093 RepID=UPI001C7026FC|nr:hypothetical protein [Citrobacter sp. EC_71]MBW9353579.1 hypothetical protein [Citrobacter sp. EC_71]